MVVTLRSLVILSGGSLRTFACDDCKHRIHGTYVSSYLSAPGCVLDRTAGRYMWLCDEAAGSNQY
jgi:hypothetical protein